MEPRARKCVVPELGWGLLEVDILGMLGRPFPSYKDLETVGRSQSKLPYLGRVTPTSLSVTSP